MPVTLDLNLDRDSYIEHRRHKIRIQILYYNPQRNEFYIVLQPSMNTDESELLNLLRLKSNNYYAIERI